MFDKLRMIFVLGGVSKCPEAQIEVYSFAKISNKQQLTICGFERLNKLLINPIHPIVLLFFSYLLRKV